MVERIELDPQYLEVMPNHAGPHYEELRTMLVQNGITGEQAIESLNNSWTRNHDERIQRWEQQTIDNANTAEEA